MSLGSQNILGYGAWRVNTANKLVSRGKLLACILPNGMEIVNGVAGVGAGTFAFNELWRRGRVIRPGAIASQTPGSMTWTLPDRGFSLNGECTVCWSSSHGDTLGTFPLFRVGGGGNYISWMGDNTIRQEGANTTGAFSPSTISNPRAYGYVKRRDSTLFRGFADGVSRVSATSSGTQGGPTTLSLGRPGGSNNLLAVRYEYLMVFAAGFTDEEMLDFYLDPFQVVSFDEQKRYWGALLSAGAAALEGAATGVATATASLTTAIQAAGSAAGVASATGTLTTGIPLNVAATVQATATGALTAEIRFQGAALAVALATAALTTGIPLDGAAAAVVVATGALTTGDGLEGAAMVQALATADLTTAVQLASDAFAVALAQAGLTTGIPLQGAGQGATLASATLTTQVQLAGAGAGVVTAVADLTGGAGSAALEGAAQVVAAAAGALTTGIPIAGAGVGASVANGALTAEIRMSVAALVQAIAQGGLTTAIQFSGAATGQASAVGTLAGAILVIDPRFHAIAPRRTWAVAA
jgi:hypothetical protein